MGVWNTSVTGNDTAKDLYSEYTAAFYKFDVEEALKKIDNYVRTEMIDETDKEEWCNYIYSLADFMWKKGILTESVKQKAIEMIDSGFGLELWEESGKKVLTSRKKKLGEFKSKLLSPMPAKKKIKPNVYTERIFKDGDIIAVQLQTAGKTYTADDERPLSAEAFCSLDGKYVLMQLVCCYTSWTSQIVPEVKDYWAHFRLFDGVYETIHEPIDYLSLQDATFNARGKLSSSFYCESSMHYFKKRNYKVLENRKDLLENYVDDGGDHIFWSINKPHYNPDSELVAAMGKQIICGEYLGDLNKVYEICKLANRYSNYDYTLSREENEAKYTKQESVIINNINSVLANGGKIYCVYLGKERGFVTVNNGHIDNLYIEGRYQRNGLGTRLLKFAFSTVENGAYIEFSPSNKPLLRICNKIGLVKQTETDCVIRMVKQ